jgi:hypothetical protein
MKGGNGPSLEIGHEDWQAVCCEDGQGLAVFPGPSTIAGRVGLLVVGSDDQGAVI